MKTFTKTAFALRIFAQCWGIIALCYWSWMAADILNDETRNVGVRFLLASVVAIAQAILIHDARSWTWRRPDTRPFDPSPFNMIESHYAWNCSDCKKLQPAGSKVVCVPNGPPVEHVREHEDHIVRVMENSSSPVCVACVRKMRGE